MTSNSCKMYSVIADNLLFLLASSMEKLHKGLLCKVNLPGYETPSGVHNYYYNQNINGKQINLQDNDVEVNGTPLDQETANQIHRFAKTVHRP